MAIRIRRISIKREGPLREDVLMEPGGLNLIFGRNETGKTYIVETMISLLFRTGRDTPWISKWTKTKSANVRTWDPRGEIEVTGLEKGSTLFTPGSRRMEDYTWKDKGLPEDLSRLMVVRAGDTRLSDSLDGVGDEVLRTHLSGNRVLDEVESNIKHETVKNAVVAGGRIEAEKKGPFKEKLTIENEIRYLDDLQLSVDENASLAVLNSLDRKRAMLEDRLGDLEDARRHRAYQLYGEQRRLDLMLGELPTEHDLIDLGTDISLCRTRRRDLDRLDGRLKDLAPVDEDLNWLDNASQEYVADIAADRSRTLSIRICGYLLPLLLLLAAAGAFFSRILTLVSAAGAAVCLVYHRMSASSPPVSSGEEERRRKLEEEFLRRFGRQLTDTATMGLVRQELETGRIKYRNALESRAEALREVNGLEERIGRKLYLLTGEEVTAERWDDEVEKLKASRKEVQGSISSIGSMLSSLGVQPDDCLPDPPGSEWDQKAYLDLRDELASVTDGLERERKSLEELKVDISVASGTSSRDIRELITALQDKRTEVTAAHRDVTARILAENSVYRAICEYRDQENIRLEEALASPEIINPLYRITGRYNGIRMTEDGGLNLRADCRGEYPLSHLSTGAAEQVYIALRTGFAQLSLGEPAFLILDDAFQHSDWVRRKNLVDHVTDLVTSGWQVFYFTMDDHLQKLLDGRGRELGESLYRYINLS
ncbi:MAG: hypothetical protein JXA64_00200 [Candidatus Fermentibacteraceae bacterium]|nr:hypothetical protein [Candidatus Fermentibacteraceae bacterium]MBN2607505.1 hypothetical protein [Candidatus Fermentibacteraceae bacterium]